MTVACITQAIVFCIGSLFYAQQCFKRGFRFTAPKDSDDGGKKKKKKKNPVTLMICFKRLFHWGFFPGLFLDVFLYASFSASDICPSNPNLCTVFFRAALFLFVLLFLAIAKAGRRGGRVDWLVGLFLLIGVSLLFWNKQYPLKIEGQADLQVIIAGTLIMVSFGAFPVMLRKATLNSGIKKVMWVMSFYSMALLIPLVGFFEGLGPWNDFTWQISWKILVLIAGCVVWSWAMVAAVAFSETISFALALHIGIILGDLGVYSYIITGYTFAWMTVIGAFLVALAFLWLLKRMITMGCHKDMDIDLTANAGGMDDDIILDDVVTTEPKNPLWMTKGNNGKKNERSSLTGGTPNYGSMPVPSGSSKKKKKGRGAESEDYSDSQSYSSSYSQSDSGKQKKKNRLSGLFKKKDKKKYQELG